MSQQRQDIRVFSIEEVEALIPELTRKVGEQLALQAELERLLGLLVEEIGEVPQSLKVRETDNERTRSLKAELRSHADAYNRGWREVQAAGAVVKDPKNGLLDFYGHVEGRLVWLCWKYGEARLGYYHALDAGFAGRRELGDGTRERLLN